jgi:cell wall-associated NlpC family hydrolase
MIRSIRISIPLLLVLFCIGCGSGNPRFSSPDPAKERSGSGGTSVRFSRELERAAREEEQEDDVRVDIEQVEDRLLEHGYAADRSSRDPRIVHPTPEQSRMLREILRHVGTPYRLGGIDGNGLDCSAYTYLVFRNTFNLDLPRSTAEQYRVGRRVGRTEVQFGDLIFFNTTGVNPSHVGIYIGDDLFAHASVSNGVTISSLESTYYRKRMTGIRRILD